jgi:hypothetical protein
VPAWWICATSRCDKSHVAQAHACWHIVAPFDGMRHFVYFNPYGKRNGSELNSRMPNCTPSMKCFLSKIKYFISHSHSNSWCDPNRQLFCYRQSVAVSCNVSAYLICVEYPNRNRLLRDE